MAQDDRCKRVDTLPSVHLFSMFATWNFWNWDFLLTFKWASNIYPVSLCNKHIVYQNFIFLESGRGENVHCTDFGIKSAGNNWLHWYMTFCTAWFCLFLMNFACVLVMVSEIELESKSFLNAFYDLMHFGWILYLTSLVECPQSSQT